MVEAAVRFPLIFATSDEIASREAEKSLPRKAG
jgi:hypothetical protein